MFNKLRRIFGWQPIEEPIEERDYHLSFKGCIHHWNWERKGQCPVCARGALRAINWSLVDKKTMDSLRGIIKAGKK